MTQASATQANPKQTGHPFMSSQDFLSHWQSYRRLTRRIIQQFPNDKLFGYTPTPPMRSFGDIAWELVWIGEHTLHGLLTNEWPAPAQDTFSTFPQSREKLLQAWDELTNKLDQKFMNIPDSRFTEVMQLAWGPMPGFVAAMYALDNENHHRGQGYVYLRALGIEPVPFWER